MNFLAGKRRVESSTHLGQKRKWNRWRKFTSAVLCAVLLSSNTAGVWAAEASAAEKISAVEESGQSTRDALSDAGVLKETTAPTGGTGQEETTAPTDGTGQGETTAPTDGTGQEEMTAPTDGAGQKETADPADGAGQKETADPAAAAEQTEPETEPEAESVYTLHLTHVFRFTVDGKGRNVSATETLELTEADFEDGVCNLNKFAQSAEQLMVTEAKPVSVDDFNENREGGARIVYAVKDGWKVVRKEDAAGNGSVLREVFQGKLGDYEFVPTDIVRINVGYKYSNTGGLAGIDAASPAVMETVPDKQTDGTYKVTWELPTVEGFRIVLDPSGLNQYVVSPPDGTETAAELEAKLENGDFDVDIDKHTIYYYQEQTGQGTHPAYNNRYSTEYNQAWNAARTLTAAGYTATAVGDNDNRGANPLENPRLEVTLTEDQLNAALADEKDLDITVYYRRNATWYTVNHWVPKDLAGALTGSEEEKNEDGVDYVRLDQETLQGRVGAMTRATAKIDGVYEQLGTVDFSQKLIENENTVVDIYYKAAESYRVIFDTDYTYIPRQQVALGGGVNFAGITEPKRTGYTFAGWRYLKKAATPDANGEYGDVDYEDAGTKEAPALTVNNDLIGKAKLQESGGVLALHLYPKWEPDTTQVRVILWTEDLTGEDDVQATASGGNSGTGSYYTNKYANYSTAPETHAPQLGTSDSHYSNMGSFTMNINTDSSLLKPGNNKELLDMIQDEVDIQFKTAMGQASGIDVNNFYTQADFEIVHEEGGEINYDATTASADGRTMIYVYFTRNIYTLQFHYYGIENNNPYSVATNTNGYSWGGIHDSANVFNGAHGDLNFAYAGDGTGGTKNNTWYNTGVNTEDEMPVPQTITIRAKYGADLRDVWPVSRAEEQVGEARMISWATTQGQYCKDGLYGAGSSHDGEPTIMGVYAAMGSEIIAEPKDTDTTHHLVAYWWTDNPSYYCYNHCYELPELNVTGLTRVSIYNGDTTSERNFLYLVPTDNEIIAKYDFNDLMRVSYTDGQIRYDDPNGTYYAVRAYNGTYYAVARQVDAVSTNTIEKQNPSTRLHMTRANKNADHSTQYNGTSGGSAGNAIGTADNPCNLYFYYDRDRYTITYMAPSNNTTTAAEVTLGAVTLPYGALVTQEKYGFELDYKDKNTNTAYGWTPAAETSVCPDRAENGTAEWTFKGWGLGPAGVNMQWIVDENTQAEAQVGDAFAIAGNMRLYAIWDEPTYTVTFHLNGGTVGTSTADIEEEVPANRRYTSTEAVIPRPLRTGYTLDGWYAADASGNIRQPETEFNFDQAITENKHVAAKWSSVNTETFDYTVYYVTDKPLDADKNKEQVQIDADGNIGTGTTYYILGKAEHTNQTFIANSSLNFSSTLQNGYVPQKTNQILTMGQPGDIYNVIFYYDPITPGKHAVNFVEAGTETSVNPTLVKTMEVKADQTVVTPQSAAAKELVNMGYALVNRAGDQYMVVTEAKDLQWIDTTGTSHSTDTLKGDAIPGTITYLVQPIPYTITYKNAADSPAAADGALNAVTAAVNIPVASANGKNPTRYTTKDTFTATNPARVFENGKWYKFSHWSLGKDTTVKGTDTTFSTLKVDPGTVGNLAFIANWTEVTDLGSLTVSKTVAGNAGERDRDFHFTVTLEDTTVSGDFGGMTFVNGVAKITLKHGESKTAENLPAGIGYDVKETEAGQDGYTTTSTGASGTIVNTGAAAFMNTKNSTPPDPASKTGNLIVSKTVSGNRGDTGKAFPFTVTLGDTSVNGKYGDMTFRDGAASFSLRHGESIRAEGLPDGIRYTVSESGNEGYTVTVIGETGTIKAGETASVLFNNHKNGKDELKDPDDPDKKSDSKDSDNSDTQASSAQSSELGTPINNAPKTGDETNLALWLTLLGISCIGVTAILAVSGQRRKGKRHKR